MFIKSIYSQGGIAEIVCVGVCHCVMSVNPCTEHLPPVLSPLQGPQYLWRRNRNVAININMRHSVCHEINIVRTFLTEKISSSLVESQAISKYKYKVSTFLATPAALGKEMSVFLCWSRLKYLLDGLEGN